MPAISRERLEELVRDLPFPARRSEIVGRVLKAEPHASVESTLLTLPDRSYASPADVGHALDSRQPSSWEAPSRHPRIESDLPPGGSAYTGG